MVTSSSKNTRSRSKREPIGARFYERDGKMAFVLASATDRDRTRGNFRHGELYFLDVRKPRNPGFHRLAHAIGKLVAANHVNFEGMPAHMVLKRLQLESGVGCEQLSVQPVVIDSAVTKWVHSKLGATAAKVVAMLFGEMGNTPILVNIPRSLSYGSMDQVEFKEVIAGLCKYIHRTYWTSMLPEEIEKAANDMLEE